MIISEHALTAVVFSLKYNFTSDDHARYVYTDWTCVKLESTMFGTSYLSGTRLVVPLDFVEALHLYRTLLGDDFKDSSKWPEWMLEECKVSGMHLDSIDGIALSAIMSSIQGGHKPYV